MHRVVRAMGCCVLLVILIAPLSASTELDDVAARQAAIDSLRSRKSGIAADCPKTRRKEEMEEDLFSIRREKVVQGKLNEDFLVFEVVDVGCYQMEDSSLVIHSIDHPGTFGYVAVNKHSGKTYRLWSDQDAASEFNRLMGDLGVDVEDKHGAESVARFYRETVLGPYRGNTVYSEFQVKQLAEGSFYRAYIDGNWSKRFSDWWNRFKTAAKKISYDEEARKVPEGYEVKGRSFEGFTLTIPRTKISGQPSLREWTLIVAPNGEVKELPTSLVFQ